MFAVNRKKSLLTRENNKEKYEFRRQKITILIAFKILMVRVVWEARGPK